MKKDYGADVFKYECTTGEIAALDANNDKKCKKDGDAPKCNLKGDYTLGG